MSLELKLTVEWDGVKFQASLSKPLDISIPFQFEGERFRAFGAEPATSAPYQAGDTVLDVQAGAGCNCQVFQFSAHLHGTHTECVGHITAEKRYVEDCLPSSGYLTAVLVSVEPIPADQTEESYNLPFEADDRVITAEQIQGALAFFPNARSDALILRTLPNSDDKRVRNYDEQPPAFLTRDAVELINRLEIEHLLLDLPSVDRAADEGKLGNHHLFWEHNEKKTITELLYVPNRVSNGKYLLRLNVSNIRSDAAPSRPVLYTLSQV